MPYKDPEERRAYGREWIRNNAEKAREAMRRWRKNHPDEHAAQSRERYARDPDKVRRIIEASPNRAAVRRAMLAVATACAVFPRSLRPNGWHS